MVLNQEKYQTMNPKGIFLRFGYSCTCNFIIKKYNKSKTTKDSDFSLHEDEFVHYVN